MPPGKPITIIGGGLAGLTLGIGLRQRAVPVTIWEAGKYPRHRVCGEFISGNGQAVLERLGLLARFEQAGAVHARTVMFVCGTNRSPVRQLAAPALCLSRHAMDALLAETFQQLGSELLVNTRWTSDECREGVVHAAGRLHRRQSDQRRRSECVRTFSRAPGESSAGIETGLTARRNRLAVARATGRGGI
jgi:2-polyprenyl-6-methoxyphenol hydroxylase-like FAD-dependent oxidoreductase